MKKTKYYKCIKTNCLTSFTVGKIYEINVIDNLKASCNFIDDNGKPNGYSSYNYKYFEPYYGNNYEINNNV